MELLPAGFLGHEVLLPGNKAGHYSCSITTLTSAFPCAGCGWQARAGLGQVRRQPPAGILARPRPSQLGNVQLRRECAC